MTNKCPLYREAVDDKPWENLQSPHAGLLFDKFAAAWKGNGIEWKFDDVSEKEAQKRKEAQKSWLIKIAGKLKGDGDLLKEYCRRQQKMIRKMGGIFLCFKNTSRFVTGLGREHPKENGFTWHSTLGVPYLPGSVVKGVLRTWMREEFGTWDESKKKWDEKEEYLRWFEHPGKDKGIGRFAFLDMIPTSPPSLTADIMTPHYSDYYQKGEIPGDWHSPNPISFLVVEEGSTWQMGILPIGKVDYFQEQKQELENQLAETFIWQGAGAKTAVGYGRFERHEETEKKQEKALEEEQKKRKERLEFQKKIAGRPDDVQELLTQAKQEDWKNKKVNNNFLDGIDGFLEDHPAPSKACISLIRDDFLEFHWKGVWDKPDAVKGKKKKPKYSSRARALVKRLKEMLE